MIISTKFLFMLQLTFFLSFFIYTFSQFLLTYSINLSYFLETTFLATLGYIINNSLFTWAFIVLRALSIFLLVGCMIGFILVFYYDVVKKQQLI
jgi:hypothetical protein